MTQITQYIAGINYIDINSRFDEEEKICCIPLTYGKSLLLILRFFDFTPDGYEIIQLADIKSIEYSESNKFIEHVVKQEGITQLIEAAPKIALENWAQVFTSLKKLGHIVIVDIGKENCVNVGRIKEVRCNSVVMRCVSPNGVWDEEMWEESFSSITGITILNVYTQMYEKYSDEEPVHKGTVNEHAGTVRNH